MKRDFDGFERAFVSEAAGVLVCDGEQGGGDPWFRIIGCVGGVGEADGDVVGSDRIVGVGFDENEPGRGGHGVVPCRGGVGVSGVRTAELWISQRLAAALMGVTVDVLKKRRYRGYAKPRWQLGADGRYRYHLQDVLDLMRSGSVVPRHAARRPRR